MNMPYKGYLIKKSPFLNEFYVFKDGFRISTQGSLEKAKAAIDILTS